MEGNGEMRGRRIGAALVAVAAGILLVAGRPALAQSQVVVN